MRCMTGALILDHAAELAATVAHMSFLAEGDDCGYPIFRTLTPHLADVERRRLWETLLHAAARQFAFSDPSTCERAAIDALDDPTALCGVDLERYRAVDPADRPGETDYDGHDVAALARDLASAWDVELGRRARGAVGPAPTARVGHKMVRD